MVSSTRDVITTINTGKNTRLMNTNVILPGTRYRIEIRGLYAYNVKSAPAIALVTTELPTPETFRVRSVAEWEVELVWRKLQLKLHHHRRPSDHDVADDDVTPPATIGYLVKVFDGRGEQVAEETYNKAEDDNKIGQGVSADGTELFMTVRNLLPGQSYKATLQAQLGDQLSDSLRTNFITKRLSTALDVAIMLEISPTLSDDDLTETKNFLVALLNAFDTRRADSVRISATQLSNRPTEIFSMKQSSENRKLMIERIKKLSMRAGTSVLNYERFNRVVMVP